MGAWQARGATMHAFTATGSLLVGASPVPGLALGAGTFGVVGLAPSGKLSAGSSGASFVPSGPRSFNLQVLGVFADYYPDARSGYHVQGAIGLAQLSAKQSANALTTDPAGIGAAFGAGEDFWVNDQWCIGGLGRVLYAETSYDGLHYSSLSPGALLSFTWY